MDPRVRSSLSEEEIVFNPYTIVQLREILNDRSRLAFNDGSISQAAINLCAAVAGRENGDARKAIDLLRVAAEIAERERDNMVNENHIWRFLCKRSEFLLRLLQSNFRFLAFGYVYVDTQYASHCIVIKNWRNNVVIVFSFVF